MQKPLYREFSLERSTIMAKKATKKKAKKSKK